MAATMGQALAARIRYQIKDGEDVLRAGGYGTSSDRTDAVVGSPQDVLSVRGNVSDVALTNHLWLLDAAASGAVTVELTGDLRQPRPASIEEAVAFLGPRDTDTAEQSLARLRTVNETIAAAVENLSDEALERPVEVTFKGQKPLRDELFIIIEHGALHIGQAWGILKGTGKA
jgi:hypothetical protein